MSFWVYLLRCADQSYYVGHTDDLEGRMAQHQRGEIAGYTTTRRPVQLVHAESFATREEALGAERQLKGWSRKKKEPGRAEIGQLCRAWDSGTHPLDRRAPAGETPFETPPKAGGSSGRTVSDEFCHLCPACQNLGHAHLASGESKHKSSKPWAEYVYAIVKRSI